MKLFKKILDKNDLKVDKYTMKGKTMIVNTPLGQFALKKGNLDNIYKYLLSRNFEYFPKVIDSNDRSISSFRISSLSWVWMNYLTKIRQ